MNQQAWHRCNDQTDDLDLSTTVYNLIQLTSSLNVHDVTDEASNGVCSGVSDAVPHHPLQLLPEQLAVHDGLHPLPPLHLIHISLNVHRSHVLLIILNNEHVSETVKYLAHDTIDNDQQSVNQDQSHLIITRVSIDSISVRLLITRHLHLQYLKQELSNT